MPTKAALSLTSHRPSREYVPDGPSHIARGSGVDSDRRLAGGIHDIFGAANFRGRAQAFDSHVSRAEGSAEPR